LMHNLNEEGRYELTDSQHKKLKQNFWGGYANDAETLYTIKKIYHEFGYVLDPHTAVGMNVLYDYKNKIGTSNNVLVVSTASPYKFGEDVLIGIEGEDLIKDRDEFEMLDILSSISGTRVPNPLKELKDKEIRHAKRWEKEDMERAVAEIFDLGGV